MNFIRIIALTIITINQMTNCYINNDNKYRLAMDIERIYLPKGSYLTQAAQGCTYSTSSGDGILSCLNNQNKIMKLMVVRNKSAQGKDFQTCSGDIFVGKDIDNKPILKCEKDSYSSFSKKGVLK